MQQTSMEYMVYIDDILGVKTNAKNFNWSYGSTAAKSTREEYEKCKIKVSLEVKSSNEVFDRNLNMDEYYKYHYFFAKFGEQKIYYERKLFGKLSLRYSIEIKENNINVIVNKNYMRYIQHRVMGLHSMSYILTDIVSGLMLRNGLATMYCATVAKGDRAIMIFAPPNTGKTLTSIRLCEQYGYHFLSEDLTLTDGENVWSIPWTSTYRYYNEKGKSKKEAFIENFLPILSIFSAFKRKSIAEYLAAEKIRKTSKISNVILLERGKPGMNFDKQIGSQKIKNLQRYLFYYHKSPALVAMNYFNPSISLESMYKKEVEIIEKIVEKYKFATISEHDALKYYERIHEVLLKKDRVITHELVNQA